MLLDSSTFRLILLLLLTLQTEIKSEKMDSSKISAAITKFAGQFIRQLEHDKSVVSSPLSVEILLALIALGSTDKAHEELLTSLGIPDDDSIRSAFSSVASKLKSIKGVTFSVANKVYLMEGPYELHQDLKKDADKVFECEMEKLDFSNSGAAAGRINHWVESKTNNRIKDLISPDALDELTRIVLVNAIYFKGMWKYPFDKSNTQNQPFHVDSNKTIEVPMMYRQATYEYGESEDLKAQLLKMPYEGDQSSMLIILPYEVNGVTAVINNLAFGYDLMAEVNNVMYSSKVEVTLPKFKIETTIDLNSLLPELGIKQIFSQMNSGLTKMLNSDESLYISKAIQKAFIEVNEEGAEAAAATAMAAVACCAIVDFNPVPQFIADKPFLVSIINEEGTPYFIGAYRGEN